MRTQLLRTLGLCSFLLSASGTSTQAQDDQAKINKTVQDALGDQGVWHSVSEREFRWGEFIFTEQVSLCKSPASAVQLITDRINSEEDISTLPADCVVFALEADKPLPTQARPLGIIVFDDKILARLINICQFQIRSASGSSTIGYGSTIIRTLQNQNGMPVVVEEYGRMCNERQL